MQSHSHPAHCPTQVPLPLSLPWQQTPVIYEQRQHFRTWTSRLSSEGSFTVCVDMLILGRKNTFPQRHQHTCNVRVRSVVVRISNGEKEQEVGDGLFFCCSVSSSPHSDNSHSSLHFLPLIRSHADLDQGKCSQTKETNSLHLEAAKSETECQRFSEGLSPLCIHSWQ